MVVEREGKQYIIIRYFHELREHLFSKRKRNTITCLVGNLLFRPSGVNFSFWCLPRQTNSGQQGVWVYEIGTTPYFSAIAPGELTELPREVSQAREEVGRPHLLIQQEVEYPPYQPVEAQRPVYPLPEEPHPQEPEQDPIAHHPIQILTVQDLDHPEQKPLFPVLVNPVQYQPQNPEVLVVEDSDINVDGEGRVA